MSDPVAWPEAFLYVGVAWAVAFGVWAVVKDRNFRFRLGGIQSDKEEGK